MKERTNEELMQILSALQNQPSNEIIKSVDDLFMTFSDWNRMTGTNTEFLHPWRELESKEMKIVDNKKEISYAEFQELLSQPYSRTFKTIQHKEEDPELLQMQLMWNEIKIKYDPITEIEELSKAISYLLTINPHEYKKQLDEMIDRFNKAVREILTNFSDDKHVVDKVNELTESLNRAMIDVNKFDELISNYSNEETAATLGVDLSEIESVIEEDLIDNYNTSAKNSKLKQYKCYDLEDEQLVIKNPEEADVTTKNVIYSECVLPDIEADLDILRTSNEIIKKDAQR